MFKLDENFLVELGLGALPPADKNKMLAHIYETLEMNVGMRLAEKMSNDQLDEFESFINSNNEAGALKWLETNFPNYKQVVAEELEKLKTEIKKTAPQIVAQAQSSGSAQQVQNTAAGAQLPTQQQPSQPMQSTQNAQPQMATQTPISQSQQSAQFQQPPQYQQSQPATTTQPQQQPFQANSQFQQPQHTTQPSYGQAAGHQQPIQQPQSAPSTTQSSFPSDVNMPYQGNMSVSHNQPQSSNPASSPTSQTSTNGPQTVNQGNNQPRQPFTPAQPTQPPQDFLNPTTSQPLQQPGAAKSPADDNAQNAQSYTPPPNTPPYTPPSN